MAKVPITTSGGKTVRKSPISSMRDGFRALKGNLKTMTKNVIGIQDGLQEENKLKKQRLERLKTDSAKQKDLKQKQSEEKRLEKPNLVSSSLSNITKTMKKAGGSLLSRVLKLVGLFAGAWIVKNIGGLIETVEKGIKVVTDVWNGIGNFVGGSIDTVKGIGKLILGFGQNILSFDFADKSGRLKEAFSEIELGWQKLNGDITGAEKVLDDPESEVFKEDFEEGGNLEEEKDSEDKEEGGETDSDSENVGDDPTNKPAIGDYKVIDTSRGSKYRVWDGGKWGSKTNVKPRSGNEWNEEKVNIDKDEDSKIESEEQVSAKEKVYQQVKAAGNKLSNQELITSKKRRGTAFVAKLTPSNEPEIITVVAPNQNQVNNNSGGDSGVTTINISGGDDLNRLESKRALEHIG